MNMATIYDYQTGEELRDATETEYERYVDSIEVGDYVGATRGDGYGYPGRTIYMVA